MRSCQGSSLFWLVSLQRKKWSKSSPRKTPNQEKETQKMGSETNSPTPSPGGKRSRDPEDEVYIDNLNSHKRYLSEVSLSPLSLFLCDPSCFGISFCTMFYPLIFFFHHGYRNFLNKLVKIFFIWRCGESVFLCIISFWFRDIFFISSLIFLRWGFLDSLILAYTFESLN